MSKQQYTLKDIFTKDISKLRPKLTPEKIKEFTTKNKSITEQRYYKVLLAQYLAEEDLLSEEETKIVSDEKFQNIMVTNPYNAGIKYLANYEAPFMEFGDNGIHTDNTFPEKYANDAEMAAVYVSTKIDDDYDKEILDDFLLQMERLHSRAWVVDMLLTIKPEDVNSDIKDNLDYIDEFSVLKYIGNSDQFRNHFTDWFNSYNEHNFELGMEYEPVVEAYLNEVAKYIPFIPECMEVYLELKALTPEEYNNPNIDGLELITETLYKITG